MRCLEPRIASALLGLMVAGALAPRPAAAGVPKEHHDQLLQAYDGATKEVRGLQGHTASIQERVQRLGMASRNDAAEEWTDARLIPSGRALLREFPGVQYLGIWAREIFPPSMRDLELALDHALEDYARRDPRPCFDQGTLAYRAGEACDALVRARCEAFAGDGAHLVARSADAEARPAALVINTEDEYVSAFRRMTSRAVALGQARPEPLTTDERIDFLFCRAVAEGGKRFETRSMVVPQRPAWTDEIPADDLPLDLDDLEAQCRAPVTAERLRGLDELLEGPRAAQNDTARRLFGAWRRAVRGRRTACEAMVTTGCAHVQIVPRQPTTISYVTVDCRRREVSAVELQSDLGDMKAKGAAEEKMAGLNERIATVRACEHARRVGYAWQVQPPPVSQRCASMPAAAAAPEVDEASALPSPARGKGKGKGKGHK